MENNELRKKVEEEAGRLYPDKYQTPETTYQVVVNGLDESRREAFTKGFDYAISLLQQREKEIKMESKIPSFEFRALIQYPTHKSWTYYTILNTWVATKNETAIVRDLLWTGLKDKNGKKIFQSDIIQKDNGVWGVVVWKQPSFEITVSAEHSSLYTKEWIEDSIVIGNIYETPLPDPSK